MHKSFLLLFALMACAKQGFPPGGPEDTTPPEVVRVFPEPGATSVDLRTVVSIGFSEWMEKRSLKESIFISPVPKVPPKITVKAKKVEIDFQEGLDQNRTYVITVGTGAKDVHGNGLKSSWTVAFSTGDRVDTGQISGQVLFWEGNVNEANILAYVITNMQQPNPAVDQPNYITQANGSGLYTFFYLSPGQYRLFAFLDTDKDGTYSVEKDPLGVPRGDVTLNFEHLEVKNRDVILTVRDTIPPECLSATAFDNIHVDLTFSEAIHPESIRSIRIKSYEEGVETPLLIRSRHCDHGDRALCHLVTERQREGTEYETDVCDIVDSSGNRVTPETCILSFIGSGLQDTVRPRVMNTSPMDSAANVALDQKIEMYFSEALDTTGFVRAFHLVTVTGEKVDGIIEWPDAATLRFVPRQELKGSSVCTASLENTLIQDLAGNRLSAAGTDLFLITLDPDTIGHISGSVIDEDSLAYGPFYVEAVNVENSQSLFRAPIRTALTEQGPFELRNLFPGHYTVWVFRDEDGNDTYSYGRSTPILFSERFTWYPDTVEVRSRWETQGIDMVLKPR